MLNCRDFQVLQREAAEGDVGLCGDGGDGEDGWRGLWTVDPPGPGRCRHLHPLRLQEVLGEMSGRILVSQHTVLNILLHFDGSEGVRHLQKIRDLKWGWGGKLERLKGQTKKRSLRFSM